MAGPSENIPEHWSREVREVAKVAKAQGWRFDTTGKNHPRFWPPADTGLQPERFAATPSDHRAWRNFIAGLQRKGLVLEVREGKKKKGKRK